MNDFHFTSLHIFGIGIKTGIFQSYGYWLVFHICWHIEWSIFTASSFRMWNHSTGISSPPLVLFMVMLPRAHLTLHSRMSGSRWVTTASWLSGSRRFFLYGSSVYSCHLFLIASAFFLGPYSYWPFFAHLCMKCSLAAKLLQLCPTLCDPIDSSQPGSPVPGILQARTLEWVPIAFSNAWRWKNNVKLLSRVRLLVTPWTAAHQAPLSMGFSRLEYWSGLPLPSLNVPLVSLIF